jgi:hypothetical protein
LPFLRQSLLDLGLHQSSHFRGLHSRQRSGFLGGVSRVPVSFPSDI